MVAVYSLAAPGLFVWVVQLAFERVAVLVAAVAALLALAKALHLQEALQWPEPVWSSVANRVADGLVMCTFWASYNWSRDQQAAALDLTVQDGYSAVRCSFHTVPLQELDSFRYGLRADKPPCFAAVQ